jgi:2-polyprenyl-3-methyl-5-hydroxy-6-metoxy-1,4-benzoquinol methylase
MQLKTLPRLVDQQIRYSLIYEKLPPPPARICEIGVGGGWLISTLHEYGYDVYGCDKFVSPRLSESSIGDRISQASGSRLDYPDDYFDVTFSCDVLEHVDPSDREAFLGEIVRITKPGGLIIVTAFFHNTKAFRLWGAAELLARASLPSWYCEHITIPLPKVEETHAFLARHIEAITTQKYQRALNLLGMWIQCNAPKKRIALRASDLIAKILLRVDFFGRPTSRIYSGIKKHT